MHRGTTALLAPPLLLQPALDETCDREAIYAVPKWKEVVRELGSCPGH